MRSRARSQWAFTSSTRTITECVTSPGRGGRRSWRTSPTMTAPSPKLSCERWLSPICSRSANPNARGQPGDRLAHVRVDQHRNDGGRRDGPLLLTVSVELSIDATVGDDGYFDERVAARYDESAAEMFDPAVVDPVVDFLVELAGSGRALELGIGTGRIALPLAQRGVPVHGIELSKAMVARLRAKPGGEDIGVDDRRLRDDDRGRDVLRRLPRLQHDHEPDDAGGAGRVLPQRRRAPRARRLLRDRGRRSPGSSGSRPARPIQRLPRERDAAGGSTSTTSRARASRPITSRSSTDESSASRFPSATRGPRSST